MSMNNEFKNDGTDMYGYSGKNSLNETLLAYFVQNYPEFLLCPIIPIDFNTIIDEININASQTQLITSIIELKKIFLIVRHLFSNFLIKILEYKPNILIEEDYKLSKEDLEILGINPQFANIIINDFKSFTNDLIKNIQIDNKPLTKNKNNNCILMLSKNNKPSEQSYSNKTSIQKRKRNEIGFIELDKNSIDKIISFSKLFDSGLNLDKIGDILSKFIEFQKIIQKYPSLFKIDLSLLGKKLSEEILKHKKIGNMPKQIKINKITINIV
ncbi:MAG: hypothetical protein ACTSRZ_13965 [Promethearchaeota archaeon]